MTGLEARILNSLEYQQGYENGYKEGVAKGLQGLIDHMKICPALDPYKKCSCFKIRVNNNDPKTS